MFEGSSMRPGRLMKQLVIGQIAHQKDNRNTETSQHRPFVSGLFFCLISTNPTTSSTAASAFNAAFRCGKLSNKLRNSSSQIGFARLDLLQTASKLQVVLDLRLKLTRRPTVANFATLPQVDPSPNSALPACRTQTDLDTRYPLEYLPALF